MIDFKNNFIDGGEMLPYERYVLYNWILNYKIKNVLETGCGVGVGSTYYIAEALKNSEDTLKFYTCDPCRFPTDVFFKQYSFLSFFKWNSEVLINHIIKNNIDIDFIMFDGPENPDVALNDIITLEKYIKPDTYFCMHDWEYVRRGYDNGISTKALKIRPYIEQSKNWEKIEVLSGLQKNSNYDDMVFDSVGLCLYKFKK